MEIQVGSIGIAQGDYMQLTRYILARTGEKYNFDIDISAKPVKGDQNRSGCHTNFSIKEMRENDNGYEIILHAIEKLSQKLNEQYRMLWKRQQ